MAITSELHWTGSTGEHAYGEGPQYTSVYRVTTTDATDQAQTIINWFRTNVVELNDFYAYSGDTGETLARAKRISAEREQASAFIWIVKVSYNSTNDKPEKGEDENGDPTDDPTQWRPALSLSTAFKSVPVEKAKYLGGYSGVTTALIGFGNRVKPMNSAFIPFVPGLEKEVPLLQVDITRNLLLVDGTGIIAATNRVNSMVFTFSYRGFTMRVEELQAKISGWRVSLREVNGIEHWETSGSVVIDPDTWVDEIADRGLAARLHDGDPDGKGGYVSPGDTTWEDRGVPRVRRLIDNDGQPVSESVLFDGNGQPLKIQELQAANPVYGKWLKYEEAVFQNYSFFDGIIF